MSRYYYSDHLAAAWMAKHHGVRFTLKDGDDRPYFSGGFIGVMNQHGSRPIHPDEALYVHPDSLHLLGHQLGDIIVAGATADLVNQPGLLVQDGIWLAGCPAVYDKADGDEPIIQRNGIAFMWPEQEP